jgi:hypothetical protein
MKNYYEPRFIAKTNQENKMSFFDENQNKKMLKDYIFDFDKIVLLGNPGIGKTIELERLFEVLWEEKEINGLIPFYINLKKFRKTSSFEDLIPFDNWHNFSSIIFILDGLDEIEDIQDFLSAFEIFISKNQKRNIKYIVSCRTNIYEKYLVTINDFQTFFLEDLTFEQASSILKKSFEIDIDDMKLDDMHFIYLKTPFFLNQLVNFYLNNQGKLPKSNAVLWDKIIEVALDEHKKKTIKGKLLSIPKLIEEYEKVAFVSELMQKNYFNIHELYRILKEESEEFIGYPFIKDLDINGKKWSFEHRQIQEYFVSRALLNKSFEEIIKIIRIEGTNSIHPSLFNVVTFLINLFEVGSDVLIELIAWIQNNQIELLFKADTDRVSDDLRDRIFQDYFQRECIKKGFWINTNRTFSVSEIARFGNVPNNTKYLINIIKSEYHFRVIISALDLLSFFKIEGYEKELKQLFLTKLKDRFLLEGIKSQILLCSRALKFDSDVVFFDEVYCLMKKEDSNEINSAFLNFIYDKEDVDSIFDYLLEEFKRIHNISKRVVPDEVLRGNDWKVSKMISKLNDSTNFIDLITYYFQDDVHINSYSGDDVELLKKCIQFAENESDFIIKLLKSIIGKTNYYTNENLLKDIIKSSNQIRNAVEYLIEYEVFSKVNYFMSSFIDEESLIIVKDNYIEGKLINEDIESLRSFIWSSGNSELSQIFNDLMIKNGFNSEKPFYTIEQFNKIQLEQKAKHQLNFDILFDTNLLFKEVELIFSNYDVTDLDNEIISKIENDWYESNGYRNNSIYTSIKFLRNLIYEYRTLSLDKLEEIIYEKDEVFYLIKSKIESNKNSNLLFSVNEEQILYIKKWVLKKSNEINFTQIFEFNNLNSFRYGKDYKKLKTVLFFAKQFDLEIEKEFLLECIAYYEMESSNETESFQFLINKIDDKDKFDNRIIENILTNDLFSFSLTKHIDYALDNKLSRVYPKIRECFLLNNYEYNLQNQFEKYVKLTNDFEVLKECAHNIKSYKCWTAIKSLVDYKKEENFCCDKAFEYLGLEAQSDNNFLSNSLEVLFEFNRKEALIHYLSLMKRDLCVSVLDKSFSNYNAVHDLEIIQELFYEIYIIKDERFNYSRSTNFLNVYISNLSKNEEMYRRVESELLKIKEKVTEDVDRGLFFVNFLLDNAKNSYINEKSKKYTFAQALELVEKIIK